MNRVARIVKVEWTAQGETTHEVMVFGSDSVPDLLDKTHRWLNDEGLKVLSIWGFYWGPGGEVYPKLRMEVRDAD